jgi:arylsulfatase A-like enzyme
MVCPTSVYTDVNGGKGCVDEGCMIPKYFAMIAHHRHQNGSIDRRQKGWMMQRCRGPHGVAVFLLGLLVAGGVVWSAQPEARKPNILIIWGDDIGWYNPGAYHRGMMGYQTPNIDRLAKEGAMFTDWYGQQSCTAGRAAFITGQSPIRTGLTKVGLPGAELGLKKEDVTIPELLKPQGYMTGQFGKNHLGDRDEHMPTAHGFDEFFGNLYHLNAEEEPENPDYPKNPEFKKRFGPRGVIKSTADGKMEDTGPLTKKRMETVDEEFTAAALDFIDRAQKANKPFFLWWNATRMHIWTHLKKESEGKTGLGIYPDGMVEHDGHVGQLLKKLDELGIADNTISMYSTHPCQRAPLLAVGMNGIPVRGFGGQIPPCK